MHHLQRPIFCKGKTLANEKRKLQLLSHLGQLVILVSLLISLPISLFALSMTPPHGNNARRAKAVPADTSGQTIILLHPAPVIFPVQTVGTTSQASTVELLVDPDSSLAISSISVSGDFAQTNTCGTGVDASSNPCFIYVTFTPTAVGTRTGTLTLVDGASGSPQTVSLSGIGWPAGAGATVTTLNSTGSAGNYTLTGTVTGVRGSDSPTGSMSFVDSSNSKLPLGTATLGTSTITLGLANGPSLPTGSQPANVVLGDFNGDGKRDMAVLNSNFPCVTGTASISIYFGKGDGSFTAAASTPSVPCSAFNIVAGDFNGDGRTDIAFGGSAGVTVLFGNADGTFTSQTTSLAHSFTLASGDVNGDGKADLVVEGSPTTVLLGQSNGTFVTVPVPSAPSGDWMQIGDVNGDGKADLILYDGSKVTVLLGNGDATFQAAVNTEEPIELYGAGYQPFALGDFNGDGKLDVVIEAGVENGTNGSYDAIVIFTGKGDGTFTVGSPIEISPSPQYGGVTEASNSGSVAVADFNGDGKDDVAVLNDDVAQVLLSNADGTFTAVASVDSGAETDPDDLAVAIADFNGDGLPDLVVVNSDVDLVTVELGQRTETAAASLTNIAVPGAGNHNIEASYAGDASFAASTSSSIQLAGSPVATELSLSSSGGTSTYGAQLELTATLSPYSAGSLTTTGEKVTFSNKGTSIGTAALSSGVATLNITSLPVGTNSLTANYAGDSNFTASNAPEVSIAVNPAAPSIALSPSSLTFAAQNVGTTSGTQTITLTNSGQVPLSVTSISASGDFAESNTCGSSIAAGAACSIAVTFTPTVEGARSGTLTIADNATGSPQTLSLTGTGSDIAVSSSTTQPSIASASGSATANIQIASAGGFSGTVDLTCAVKYQGTGTPTNAPTCSINPSQEQVSAGSAATATLTVSTTAAEASAQLEEWLFPSGTALATLLFFGFVPRRRWRGTKLLVLLCAAAAISMLGCGGSTTKTGGSSSTNSDTTAGSYTVIVTATSGTVTSTMSIPLSVQ